MGIYAAKSPALAAEGVSHAALVANMPAYGVGDFLNPKGWRPQPFWLHRRMADGSVKGVIDVQQAPMYVRAGGAKGGRRVTPPKHLNRERQFPKLVTPTSHAHERRLRAEGCIPATEMPGEVIDLIIDAYGPSDLPPEVTGLCRARMSAVASERARAEAEKAAKKAKPAGTSSKPGTKAAGRAPCFCGNPGQAGWFHGPNGCRTKNAAQRTRKK